MTRNNEDYEDDPEDTGFVRFDIWPIPIKMLEALQRMEYWDMVVAKNGMEAFRPEKTSGRRVDQGTGGAS